MYTKKIKIFEDCNYKDLESKVNEFLAQEAKNEILIFDVEFNAFGNVDALGAHGIYYASIYYRDNNA